MSSQQNRGKQRSGFHDGFRHGSATVLSGETWAHNSLIAPVLLVCWMKKLATRSCINMSLSNSKLPSLLFLCAGTGFHVLTSDYSKFSSALDKYKPVDAPKSWWRDFRYGAGFVFRHFFHAYHHTAIPGILMAQAIQLTSPRIQTGLLSVFSALNTLVLGINELLLLSTLSYMPLQFPATTMGLFCGSTIIAKALIIPEKNGHSVLKSGWIQTCCSVAERLQCYCNLSGIEGIIYSYMIIIDPLFEECTAMASIKHGNISHNMRQGMPILLKSLRAGCGLGMTPWSFFGASFLDSLILTTIYLSCYHAKVTPQEQRIC